MVNVLNQTFLNYDNVNNVYTWAFRRTGYMAYRISEIFAAEFGESKRNNQFRVVLAGQGANSYIVMQGITLINKFFGPPSKYLYAIASAPYYILDNNYSGVMNTSDVLDELAYQARISPQSYGYATYVCLSKFWGLKHFAYEGGPDTYGSYNVDSKRAAHLDPRMKQITIDFLTTWFSYGFDAFLYYTTGYGTYSSSTGAWAWAETMNDSIHPKKDGVIHMINNPNVPYNTSVFRYLEGSASQTTQLSIPAIKHQLAGTTYTTTFIPYSSVGINQTLYYPFVAGKRGIYSVSVETQYAKQGGSIGIYWNNDKMGSVLCNSKVFNFSLPLNTSSVIEKGISVVTLYIESDKSYSINTVNITLVTEVQDSTPTTPTTPTVSSSQLGQTSTVSNRTVVSEGSNNGHNFLINFQIIIVIL
ncbi:predicted protein [Naegleria gruberi]|uniref:Predicted protein n=1 Tax=Naegleria gruberi TaxID=5762 RepID=D2V4D1_NAEGR|nr:uncharacterized protein NAEGRDRAFT_63683 [Naegleria gruberi]EFC48364.1 predicted protein [Naegleria gruberi]|eukprot:XP_002681108.1 predicted protein [Naegleria gruberi strain NEG-M]